MTTILNKVPLESGGSLKLPGTPLPSGAGDSINRYLGNFPFRIRIQLGRVYSQEFKEFNAWCESHLGNKYKDWFLTSGNNNYYTLYLKDTKKSLFLALKYSESIDSSSI
jgi:hypothetical protein